MTSLEKEHSSATRWQQLLGVSDPRLPAVAYLLYLSLAEALTVLVQVQAGVSLHLVGLFLLLLHTARAWDRPQHRFLLAMALVPLIRVVSLSLPLVGFPLVYWYLLTSIPLFAAVAVIMHLLGMDWRQAGWHGHVRHNWLWQPLVALSGLAIGAIEYFILRPQPLAGAFAWRELWLPALILLVSTGYLEELIFRRVMQRTAAEQLGPWRGIVYVAILFAVLHVGYLSLVDGLFVLLVGLLFGWVVHRTGSLVGFHVTHVYDPAGNRTVQIDSGSRTTYVYDDANQLSYDERL